jgi:hypothetical protein
LVLRTAISRLARPRNFEATARSVKAIERIRRDLVQHQSGDLTGIVNRLRIVERRIDWQLKLTVATEYAQV